MFLLSFAYEQPLVTKSAKYRYSKPLLLLSFIAKQAVNSHQAILGSWERKTKHFGQKPLGWGKGKGKSSTVAGKSLHPLQNLNMLVQDIHCYLIIQAAQHVSIATVATEQIGEYARTTTSSIRKRFLEDEQRSEKRVRMTKVITIIELFCFRSMLKIRLVKGN
jgi:hypothetical protein